MASTADNLAELVELSLQRRADDDDYDDFEEEGTSDAQRTNLPPGSSTEKWTRLRPASHRQARSAAAAPRRAEEDDQSASSSHVARQYSPPPPLVPMPPGMYGNAMREQRRDRIFGAAAPGGEGDVPAEQVFVPSPDFISAQALGARAGPARCFACLVGNPDRVKSYPAVWAAPMNVIFGLVKFATKSTNRFQLSQDIAAVFETNVRAVSNKVLRPGQRAIDEWSAGDIYDHFFTCKHGLIDAEESTAQRILCLENVRQTYQDTCLYSRAADEADDEAKPNAAAVEKYVRVSKHLSELYKTLGACSTPAARAHKAEQAFSTRGISTYGCLPAPNDLPHN
jgi:hypothetical protein